MPNADGSYSPGLQTHGHHFSDPEEEEKTLCLKSFISSPAASSRHVGRGVLRRPLIPHSLSQQAGLLISTHAPEPHFRSLLQHSGCFRARGCCGFELPGTRALVSFPVCVGNGVDSENKFNS